MSTQPGAHTPQSRRRVEERAGEAPGPETGKRVRRALIRKVQAGEVAFARKLSHSRSLIVANWNGGELAFIYSSRRKAIVAFLPPQSEQVAQWRIAPKQGSP